CRPTRTWHGRRLLFRRFAIAFFVMSIVLIWVTGNLVYWIKPGELTSPHAQILSSSDATARCAACHVQVGGDIISWVSLGGTAHDGLTSSDLCLDCHHSMMGQGTARFAHNVPAELRSSILTEASLDASDAALRKAWRTTSLDQDAVECSVCHREHGGAESSLTHVSDAQCQTCHRKEFMSFSIDHPEFDGWPYRDDSGQASQGGFVSFDHARHEHLHFSKSSTRFECTGCHQVKGSPDYIDQDIASPVRYETACAACHDDALQVASGKGIEALVLPTLPDEWLPAGGRIWPEAAVGFADGQLPPMLQLMLRGSPLDAGQLSSVSDLSAVDPDDEDAAKVGKKLGLSILGLIQEVRDKGQRAVERRLVSQGIREEVAKELMDELSPQHFDAIGSRWFGKSGSNPKRFDESELLPSGGWYRDDLRLKLAYRGRGHKDPKLRAFVEMVGDLASDDPMAIMLQSHHVVKACTSCHPGVGVPGQQAAWSEQAIFDRQEGNLFSGFERSFTRFSHKPHLNISTLSDCTACHQTKTLLATTVEGGAVVLSDDHGFEAVTRDQCASCHRKGATSESCTLCHRYHIDIDPWRHRLDANRRVADSDSSKNETPARR
ncbi:MAG: hypothetical protein AAF989_10180, partial [Planctomycetota bacterium]